MFEKERDFLPFTQLTSEQIHLGGVFPEWLEMDKVALNQKRLETLLRICGVCDLLIAGYNEGETSNTTPMIAGFNQSGEAFAAKASTTTRVPTQQEEFYLDPFSQNLPHEIRKVFGAVVLNNNEIVQRIQEDKRFKSDVRSTQAWSHYIDQSLRHSVERIGINHLVLGFNRHDLSYYKVDFSLIAVTGIMGFLILGNPTLPLWAYAGLRIGSVMYAISEKKGRRISLIPGPQLDRAAALMVLTRTSKLVKPLPQTL